MLWRMIPISRARDRVGLVGVSEKTNPAYLLLPVRLKLKEKEGETPDRHPASFNLYLLIDINSDNHHTGSTRASATMITKFWLLSGYRPTAHSQSAAHLTAQKCL